MAEIAVWTVLLVVTVRFSFAIKKANNRIDAIDKELQDAYEERIERQVQEIREIEDGDEEHPEIR